MNYKDMWATDENGNQFIFTVEMQRRLSEQGLEVVPESLKELTQFNPTAPKPKPAVSTTPSQPYHDEDRSTATPHPISDLVDQTEATFEAPMTIQIDPETGQYIGRMKWYNAQKGYGFIVRGGGEEIFFHKSNISGDPENFTEGQWILYDIEETHKGPEAAEVESYSGDVSQLS